MLSSLGNFGLNGELGSGSAHWVPPIKRLIFIESFYFCNTLSLFFSTNVGSALVWILNFNVPEYGFIFFVALFQLKLEMNKKMKLKKRIFSVTAKIGFHEWILITKKNELCPPKNVYGADKIQTDEIRARVICDDVNVLHRHLHIITFSMIPFNSFKNSNISLFPLHAHNLIRWGDIHEHLQDVILHGFSFICMATSFWFIYINCFDPKNVWIWLEKSCFKLLF